MERPNGDYFDGTVVKFYTMPLEGSPTFALSASIVH